MPQRPRGLLPLHFLERILISLLLLADNAPEGPCRTDSTYRRSLPLPRQNRRRQRLLPWRSNFCRTRNPQHPPHHAVNTWHDFFIHIATIVVGLLIAISLEQTVEAIHHRNLAGEARENIQREIEDNIRIVHLNRENVIGTRKKLMDDAVLLDSDAPDTQLLTSLTYKWNLDRPQSAAWSAAKIDGSLAFIKPQEISNTNYFYDTSKDLDAIVFAYFVDIDTAASALENAKATGKISASARQQLMALNASAEGRAKLLIFHFGVEESQLRSIHLHS